METHLGMTAPFGEPLLRRLGSLSDPDCHNEPLVLDGTDPALLATQLEQMLLIRQCEEKLGDMKRDGLVGGPVHLGIGQEAVAVGVSRHLRPSDRVFGAHRSHSHILALGVDPRRMFAEILGRDNGLCRGMGGSMHLWHEPSGFYGSVPIVSGTVGLAVGAALAAKMDGNGDIAVAYFGDGACEEGAVQESLNLARTLQVPILFVAENNLFSSHMHVSLRQPSDCMARFADAHGIVSRVVDGNDVLSVAREAGYLTERARATGTPVFLEAVTFRWRGHVDWREDIDVGVHRSGDELVLWKRRDPVRRLVDALLAAGHLSGEGLAELTARISAQVEEAWRTAESDEYPAREALTRYVYATDRPL